MPETRTHETLVGQQFGSVAEAYLHSASHAESSDVPALAALVDENARARVLDLGCGAGHVSFWVSPRAAEVVAYDLSPEMLEIVARTAAERGLSNIETRQGVVEKLPFSDATFDYVFSRMSAHHWRDFEAGIREAARVLKPGGLAAFVDTISPGVPLLDTYVQAAELLRDPSHVRSYSRSEWEGAMARAGLKPGSVATRRSRLEFASWTARMRTPQVRADAIRSLQAAMSETVARYFDFAPDGSFNLDVAIFQASKLS